MSKQKIFKQAMIAFEFVPIVEDHEAGVSQLSPGHIIVTGEEIECSSRDGDAVPMLIISVSSLLEDLYDYLIRNWDKQYIFAAMEGDYRFKILKLKSGVMRLSCGRSGKVIAQMTPAELRIAVWEAVRSLYAQYASTFDAVVAEQSDTSDTEDPGLQNFEAVLNKWQSSFPNLPSYR